VTDRQAQCKICTFGLYSAFRACSAIVFRSSRTSRLTVATIFLVDVAACQQQLISVMMITYCSVGTMPCTVLRLCSRLAAFSFPGIVFDSSLLLAASSLDPLKGTGVEDALPCPGKSTPFEDMTCVVKAKECISVKRAFGYGC
jgi:hypothetical protein